MVADSEPYSLRLLRYQGMGVEQMSVHTVASVPIQLSDKCETALTADGPLIRIRIPTRTRKEREGPLIRFRV